MPQTENHAVRVKYSCLISRELGVCNVSSPVCTALDDAISVAASPVCHTAETLLTVEKTGNTKRAQIITFGNVYKKKTSEFTCASLNHLFNVTLLLDIGNKVLGY